MDYLEGKWFESKERGYLWMDYKKSLAIIRRIFLHMKVHTLKHIQTS